MPEKVIRDIRELTKEQLRVVISKAEIKGKGTFKPPSLDLISIKTRADELDGASQLKADIYMLLLEIKRLANESSST